MKNKRRIQNLLINSVCYIHIIAIISALTSIAAFPQGVGINTTTPDPSAALDIQSTNKGLLVLKVPLPGHISKSALDLRKK